jgi:tetratricopeptide (TPR) repeat protein
MALCIGIDAYQPASGYTALSCARADARVLGAVFRALQYDTVVMTDDSTDASLVPTRANVQRQLGRFTADSVNPHDTLVITFAGHGDVVAGVRCLIPLDYDERHAAAVPLEMLFSCIKQSAARNKLVILDACRSDNRGLGVDFLRPLKDESILVLSACGADQSSVEDVELGHGRFTAELIRALAGEAFLTSSWRAPATTSAAGTDQADDTLAGEAYPKDEAFLTATRLAEWVGGQFKAKGWAQRQTPQLFGHQSTSTPPTIAWREVTGPPPLTDTDAAALSMFVDKVNASLSQSDYNEAIKWSNTALRIDAAHADAIALRGLALLNTGDRVRGERDARASLRRDPHNATALHVRGLCAAQQKRRSEAMAWLGRAAELVAQEPARWPAVGSASETATRWLHLGYAHSDEQQSIVCYTRAASTPHAPPTIVAKALVDRGVAQGAIGRPAMEIDDYTSVIALRGAPVDQVAMALLNRGFCYGQLGQPEKEISDYARVIDMPDVPVLYRAWALYNRGFTYTELGSPRKGIDDCTAVIEMSGAPGSLVARALANRGRSHGRLWEIERAVEDYTQALGMRDAPRDIIAPCLLNRAHGWTRLDQPRKAVEDFSRVIEMNDASPEHVAQALLGRANVPAPHGNTVAQIADCTRVIEMPGVPAYLVASALLSRGVSYTRSGKSAQAIDDYTRLLAIEEASPNLVGAGLLARGWERYLAGQLEEAQRDTLDALHRDPQLLPARYNLALILLRQKRFGDARQAYDAALQAGPLEEALLDLAGLRDRLNGPPETSVFLGWLEIRMGRRQHGEPNLRWYLQAHPDGELSGWARQLLAPDTVSVPATRP